MSSLRERLSRFDRELSPVSIRPARVRRFDWAREVGLLPSDDGAYPHLLRTITTASRPGLDASCWTALSGEPTAPPFPWAIVDTETTGLEGGTGTLVFLTAVYRIDPDGTCLTQRFLTEPASEPSLLAGFCEDLQGAGAILSYNGKSFDLPRLRARLRLHRMSDELLQRPHLDLLHLSRRVARTWLADARLASMEKHLLGIERVDDLPGSEVPEIYRRWLVEADSAQLDRVLLHNRHDVENLYALALRLSGCVQRPVENGLPTNAAAAIGRLLEARGRSDAAERCYQSLLADANAELRSRLVFRLAALAARRADFDRACELWISLVGPTAVGILARVELAKHFEHRRREPKAAAAQTRAALLELASMSGWTRALQLRMQLRYRLERLERKALAELAEDA